MYLIVTIIKTVYANIQTFLCYQKSKCICINSDYNSVQINQVGVHNEDILNKCENSDKNTLVLAVQEL